MTVGGARSKKAMPIGRRCFLRAGAGAVAAVAALNPLEALASYGYGAFDPAAPVRQLSLFNLNTGERSRFEYWVQGRYVNDALSAINHMLRDHHDGSVHMIDPRLVDVIYGLFRLTGGAAPIEVVCGYRSPRTNARMHASHGGVAGHSLHVQGKAVDIRIPGCALSSLRGLALALRAGGVGYYPRSNFVHVDTGPIRTWGGHGGIEEFDEAPSWREALLQDPVETTSLPGGGQPTATLEAVAPRGRVVSEVATNASPARLPGHKPMRVATHDPAAQRAEGFLVRRKPRFTGG